MNRLSLHLPRRRGIVVVALVWLALPVIAQFPRETYLGVFAGPTRVGYMQVKTDKADHDGKPGYRIETTLKTKMNLMGADMTQDISSIIDTDDMGAPLTETFVMSSGGSVTKIEARCFADRVECKLQSGESVTSKTIPVPAGLQLVSDPMLSLSAKPLEVGQKLKVAYFDPLMMSVDKLDIEVLRKEIVDLGSVFKGETLVVKSVTMLGDITTWQEANGDIVKAETLMNITMVRETREQSLASLKQPEEKPALDFAVMTSVKANIDLPNPRKVTKLNVRLVGIPGLDRVISDRRQRATASAAADGKYDVDYEIKTTAFDPKKSIGLPVKLPGLAHLLDESPYIEVSNPEIQATAKQILGGEKKAYAAARKISRWIKANMVPQTDIGVVRSSVEVLKSRRGVCRDYAILFASLARAAGIPTRLAAGLVYINGGFYYHVWDECFVGEWTPFDPTIDGDFVDATHIKLAQGEATAMFEMAKVIGGLKAEIKR